MKPTTTPVAITATKKCITCQTVKALADFTDQKNSCRVCRNKADVERRKRNKTALVPDNKTDVRTLMNQLQNLQNILLEEYTTRELCEKLNTVAAEIVRISDLMYDGIVMELHLNIPENLHNFLIQMKDGNTRTNFSCLRVARAHLVDNRYAAGFEEHYGIAREELVEYADFLEDLDRITAFVRVVYSVLVDDYLADKNSKFVKESDHIPEQPFRGSSIIRFDAASDTIVADGNPLKLDGESFMNGVEELVKKDHDSVVAYVKAGYYAKFKDALLL
jgi:hypothetical protein